MRERGDSKARGRDRSEKEEGRSSGTQTPIFKCGTMTHTSVKGGGVFD